MYITMAVDWINWVKSTYGLAHTHSSTQKFRLLFVFKYTSKLVGELLFKKHCNLLPMHVNE